MAGFWRDLGTYARSFFSNWTESDAALGTKARLLVRNRSRSLFHGGCCGHHGEPGC